MELNSLAISIIVVFIIVLIVISFKIKQQNAEYKRINLLKEKYEQSLLGNNKAEALKAGRQYYSAKRGGQPLTIYDEQALTNDLSTMIDN